MITKNSSETTCTARSNAATDSDPGRCEIATSAFSIAATVASLRLCGCIWPEAVVPGCPLLAENGSLVRQVSARSALDS